MRDINKHYIGGRWAASRGNGRIDVVDATTEEVLATVTPGTAEDVDDAVRAACAAIPGWAASNAQERQGWLLRLADALEARQEDIARTVSREVGTPIGVSKAVQARLPVKILRSYAALLDDFEMEEKVGNSLVVREPIGVVAAITPWNYPLHQVVGKIAPALAAGCTVVVKPSEVAPLSAIALAEAAEEINLPIGVLNVVMGTGPEAGEALAAHPRIDMVSFTGSTRAGVRVAEVAAPAVKRVTQELGGKSANVILEDADFERAVRVGVHNAFMTSGQTCSAWTRMLVPGERHDEAVAIAKATAEAMPVGDPESAGVRIGPLVSAVQRDRVRGYIQKALDEGALPVTGGVEPPHDRGFFVAPTIFAGVDNHSTLAQEEIFGPVLVIIPYDDEDHAVALANATDYGLAGAVWSQDEARALRVARRLRTGQVDINGGRFNPLAPFGGYKQSGNGREFGRFGFEEYLEVKAIQR
ncbi:MAG: aldehyde dehydrogenase family protein [Acidobacteriota bacterium]